MGVVNGVWEMLRFEAQAGVARVRDSSRTDDGAIESVGGVELDAGLGGEHLEDATALGVNDASGQDRRLRAAGQDEVMVVTGGGKAGLLVARADRCGLREVQRCAFDPADFAGRDQLAVGGGVVVRRQPEFVAEDVARAGQVKVTVVGEVDRGGPIGGGGEVESQLVRFSQCIDHRDGQVPRVTFLAMRAGVGEGERSSRIGAGIGAGAPELLVKGPDAAVEVVGTVVLGQGIGLAVEGELGVSDAVGDSSGDRPKVRVPREVAFEMLEPKHDIRARTVAVGDFELRDDKAVLGHVHSHPVAVGQGVELDRFAVGQMTEGCGFERHVQGMFSGVWRRADCWQPSRPGSGAARCGWQRRPPAAEEHDRLMRIEYGLGAAVGSRFDCPHRSKDDAASSRPALDGQRGSKSARGWPARNDAL